MRISWNWLKRYVATDITPQQAAAVLTSTGLETESVHLFEPVKGMLQGVVVGHVLECDKHPDADRLSLCLVDLGQGEPVRIVCGAPNVAAGQKVLVATVGCVLNLADGTSITIKKSKIRGQESNGMICAEDELGLGQSHEGIMVLDPGARTGMAASEYLGLTSDHVLEIGLTPNRTDAMGHVGVARDLVAALNHREGAGLTVEWPAIDAFAQDDSALTIHVEVKDTHACPRYAGVTLTNVKVGPSPAWLKESLTVIGLKSINNVVDVTNFVQHELGQPLHAFDAAKLRGGRIVVRMAAANEPFTTLDGVERKLNEQDLVIADAERPACIAGVFGGMDSGVGEATTSIFLESACFDPSTVRRTARRHGLNTDASFRFERGVDPELTVYALKRAALLLKEVAGAHISSSVIDIDHLPKHAREVHLRFADVERLAGVRIDHDAIVQVLEGLDFRIKERTVLGVHALVPAYRVDVYRPADVIEEILRIHGYDQVPIPERLMCPPVRYEALNLESLRQQLGAHLAARGFREVMTPSLVNGARSTASGVTTAEQLVRLQNPLSAELDVMRPTMLFGALSALAHNIDRQQRDLRFFERGRTYGVQGDKTHETEMLSIILTGRRWRERWRSDDRKAELADVKEELEGLLERLGLADLARWEPVAHALLENAHALHIKGRHAGVLGAVRNAQLKEAGIGQPVFFAEVAEEVLLDACRARTIGYNEIARYPSVRRDLSLLLAEAVRFEQLHSLAFNAERKLLRAVDLFDVYQGDKLPAGKKSYALSFILQDPEKTLTDEQVDKAMGRIRQAFEKELGAELRG
ncbi:MAG: phenylalanine--tRNA ligase subunit beta [Flavobacteriales bacterium]